MDTTAPDWILNVLTDLITFTRKNGMKELSFNLEVVHMKHAGRPQDAEILELVVDASFVRGQTASRRNGKS